MNPLNPSAPIWGQAFRPMFLLAALFSALAMALWSVGLFALDSGKMLAGVPQFVTVNGTFWHSHEMLFGFAAAVVAGFLLTAVQNWTGQRATHGKSLLTLTLVWLAARVLVLCGDAVPWWLTAIVDMAFLPMVAWFFFSLLHTVKQKRNYFFSVVMLFMTAMNAVMHYGNHINDMGLVHWGGHAVSLMIILFISVIGGRVMPMFTANGTMTARVPNLEWLDKGVLGSTWLLVALFITTLDNRLPGWVMAAVCFVAAALQAYRIFRLKLSVTWKVPLLWSLHLSYWFIPVGLLMLGVHYFDGALIAFTTALHALTAGAIGGMILAMIARVALGHSGRPLVPHKLMSIGFVLLLLAAAVRSIFVVFLPSSMIHLYAISGVLWTIAFAIFVLLYFRILITPRPDGRAG